MIKTTTRTSYAVTYEGFGGTFSPDGYSQYTKRWRLREQGKLPKGELIYGYEQALEHITELRQSVYNNKHHLANNKFQIVVTTSVITTEEVEPTQEEAEQIARLVDLLDNYNQGFLTPAEYELKKSAILQSQKIKVN